MLKSFKEKDFYYPFVIWLLIVFWYFAFLASFFNSVRLKSQDIIASHSFYIFHKLPREASNITIVAIDEISRANLNLKWPWKRSVTAKLIRNISFLSPKAIGLDIVFSGESQEDEDKELASALRSHANIVLGSVLRKDAKELPLGMFVDASGATGFVNKPLDENNVLNSTRNYYIDKDGNVDISLDIRLLAAYLNTPYEGIKFDKKGIREITPLNYLVHYSEFTTIPAFLVLENKISPDDFKDKIVLVGSTDPLIKDEYLTPLGIFSGVSIIGNSLTMMLSKRFIHNVAIWQTIFIILILGTALIFINKKASFALSSVFAYFILFCMFFASLYLRSKDIQFDYFGVFILSICSYTVSNIYKYSYLIYMRNKLKNLAVVEPVTNFYTLRFFLLKLDEELSTKSKDLAFFTVVISQYSRLILDLNFEALQSLVRSLAAYIKADFKKEFKKTTFCRISQDAIGIAVWGKKRQRAEVFFKNSLARLKNKTKTPLGGILIYKHKNTKAKAKDIISDVEALLDNYRKMPQRDLILAEFTQKAPKKKREPLAEDILDFLAKDLVERNKELERSLKELMESKKQTEDAYVEAMHSLVKALEQKDTYTQDHSERTANYARKIAQEIGLNGDECELIYKASLLHDIGKIGLPDYILRKREKLTDEEITLIRKHEIASVEILKPIKAFKDLLPIIISHHEDFNGAGYPYGLSGDAIPRGAQILAVADTFDAISCGRGYKEDKNLPEAIKELEGQKGKRLNPIYVDALKKILHA